MIAAVSVVLGPAPASSAPAIAHMSRDLVEAGLPWRWRPGRVLRHIASPGSEVVQAVGDRRLAGFSIAEFGEDQVHLLLLAVHPDLRRQGLGRQLVSWIETMASVAGCRVVSLEARRTWGDTRAFYEDMGYRVVGVVTRFFDGREDAVRFQRDLTAPTFKRR